MIPSWLATKLANPPSSGDGVHAWLYATARHLHTHLDGEQIVARLAAAVTGVGRAVSDREIREAVANSRSRAWRPVPSNPNDSDSPPSDASEQEPVLSPNNPSSAKSPAASPCVRRIPERAIAVSSPAFSSFPRPCPMARRGAVQDANSREFVAGLSDLWERSPVSIEKAEPPDFWIDLLFPNTQWLCLAPGGPETARTRLRESWRGESAACGLIVPSPMTGAKGRRQGGGVSPRCLENTGPRRWLVIEFDDGSIDEQAALHWHLDSCAIRNGWPRLTLAVHSGGKSLHGWYGPCRDEENSRALMAAARHVGADPAAWSRCQLVRLPGGVRTNGRPQGVYYCAPAHAVAEPSLTPHWDVQV